MLNDWLEWLVAGRVADRLTDSATTMGVRLGKGTEKTVGNIILSHIVDHLCETSVGHDRGTILTVNLARMSKRKLS